MTLATLVAHPRFPAQVVTDDSLRWETIKSTAASPPVRTEHAALALDDDQVRAQERRVCVSQVVGGFALVPIVALNFITELLLVGLLIAAVGSLLAV